MRGLRSLVVGFALSVACALFVAPFGASAALLQDSRDLSDAYVDGKSGYNIANAWIYNGVFDEPYIEIGYLDKNTNETCMLTPDVDYIIYDFTVIDGNGSLDMRGWPEDEGQYTMTIMGIGKYSGYLSVDISVDNYDDSLPVGTWKKNSTGWWYAYDGGYAKDGMFTIGGKQYLFDSRGYMLTGWQKVNGGVTGKVWVYANSNGALQTGWAKIGGYWYYFCDGPSYKNNIPPCAMVTGLTSINGKWYLFQPGGKMTVGWGKDTAGTWYYASSSGALYRNGWITVSGKKYYMVPESGAMLNTSFLTLNGKTYYLKPSGAMTTGWYNVGTSSTKQWIYCDSYGVQKFGWQKIGGYWYYLDRDNFGIAKNAPCFIGDKGYFFDTSCRMRATVGWVKDSYGTWYYVDSTSGYLHSGWLKSGGYWYYFYGPTDASGYPGMAYCGDGIVNDDGSLMVPAPYGTDGASHIDKYGHYYEAAFG